MLGKISKRVKSRDYESMLSSREAIVSDLTDGTAREFLHLLDQFAAPGGRYFHLDTISGKGKEEDYWIEKKWLCRTLALGPYEEPTFYRVSGARNVVIALEKVARALSQLVVAIAAAQGVADNYRCVVAPFHGLGDSSLGCTCYSRLTEHGA